MILSPAWVLVGVVLGAVFAPLALMLYVKLYGVIVRWMRKL